MKKALVLILIVAMALSAAMVSAHEAGPCDDTDGDDLSSGQEYAAHHISALAKTGGLGNGGHKPGIHQGFSVCL